jgi:microcystin-dependent protein
MLRESFDLNSDGSVKVNGNQNVDGTLHITSLKMNNLNVLPPVGSIMAYLGSSEPEGWIFCNGRSRQNDGRFEPLLRLGIGTRSVGQYTPPNLINRFLKGVYEAVELNTMNSASTVTLTTANLPSHTHDGTTGGMSANRTHNHNGSTEDMNRNTTHSHATYNGQNAGIGGRRDNVAFVRYGVEWTAAAQDWYGPNEIALNIEEGRGGRLQDLTTSDANINHAHGIPSQDIEHTHSFTTNAAGSGSAFTVPPPLFYGVNYILKY